jgi:NADH:ubiquinone oxidoreductase subunit E
MAGDIKFLVVDDENVIVRSVQMILKAEGYDIEGASSGKDAILKMEQNKYDLVLTDLMMPEMDGIALIRWLKENRPEVGVVILTGYPSQETIKEALELGIIDYVPKPFTPAVLLDVTQRAIEWLEKKAPVEEKAKKDEFPPSMIEEIERVIKKYKNKPGSSIPVLQRCQQIVGYLPPEIQKIVAKGLNLSPAQVHGIVSFYSFFTMTPRGDHNIRVCLGTACYVKRVEESLNKIKDELKIDVGGVTDDRKFSIEAVRCLGACGLAPVVVIDEETYGAVTPKKITEILKDYA